MTSGSAADLVLQNGCIYTMDAPRSWATSLAVRHGRIAAVVNGGDLSELVGPDTRVVDLRGRTVLPGFQDAHVHPPTAGLGLRRCNLHDDPDADAYLETIRSYARDHPDEQWVLGGGWGMDAFPGGTPTTDQLDAVVPDRPVFLVNRDGHGAWVNSVALGVAGIDASTPDPPDGRIERTAGGAPAGTLQEGAMRLVGEAVPPTTVDDYMDGLRAAQEYLFSLGVTAWQDADVTPDTQVAYRRLAEDGFLRARVVGALWWERSQDESQIEELKARRVPFGRFRPTSVKMMLDGVCENFTASMLEPYLGEDGRPTGNSGIDFIDPDVLGRYVTLLDQAGFQLHFHAIGDRAVRSALDAVEAARATNGHNDLRHHIAHIQVIASDDIPRFRRLGVVANAQPFWAVHEAYQNELTIPFLGPERSARQYPFGSLVRSGAALAFGSDWSVSTPDPLLLLETAVTRIAPGDRDAPAFYPDERIDLPAALGAFTMGSAYVNHLETETGSLEAGKLADLVVLDRDLFGPDPIGDVRVDMTFVEGERVYGGDE